MAKDIFDEQPQRTRADDYNSELQQEATSRARTSGAITDAIMEVIDEQSGAAARVDLIEKVPVLLVDYGFEDFDDEHVIKATHWTDEGNQKNYFHSALDYVLTEMKLGNHGEDKQITADESGHVKIWLVGSPTQENIEGVRELAVIKELAHLERNPTRNPRLKSKQALLRKAAIQQLVDDFKNRSPEQKGVLRKVGRDRIVDHAIKHGVSISEACDMLSEGV